MLLNEHRTTLHRKGGGREEVRKKGLVTECIQTCKTQERDFFVVQGGSWPRDESSTKTVRKPYENRTKTVKAPYRESYLNLSKPPHENRKFL